jgi:hypothetical protein
MDLAKLTVINLAGSCLALLLFFGLGPSARTALLLAGGLGCLQTLPLLGGLRAGGGLA